MAVPRPQAVLLAVCLLVLVAVPGLAQAPSLSATKTVTIDTPTSGEADPGDTLTYTVVITNAIGAAAAALNVRLRDVIDPNTTYVANSLATVPVARGDSYDAIGNVTLSIAAPGVLANDQDFDGDSPVAIAASGATANGGTYSLLADGSFTYNSSPGFTGTDTFTYTIDDGDGNQDTATVTLTMADVLWFIDASAPAGGNGTQAYPYQFITFINSVGPNAAVYVADGNYTAPVTLKNGQRVVGDGVGTTAAELAAATGLAPLPPGVTLPTPSGVNPAISSISGNVFTLAANNGLHGLTIGARPGAAIAGSNFGTLTVSRVTITNNGRILDLDNGALAASFDQLVTTSATGTVIDLESVTGSLTVDSSTVVNTGNAVHALVVGGTSNLALDLGFLLIGSPSLGVDVTNSGSLSCDQMAVAAPQGTALKLNGGSFALGSTASTVSGAGALDFTDVAISGGATFLSLTSLSSAGHGVRLDNVTGTLTANGGGLSQDAGGAILVDGGSPSFTYAGGVSNSAATGELIEITGTTGGFVTVNAPTMGSSGSDILIRDTAGAVALDLNDSGQGTLQNGRVRILGHVTGDVTLNDLQISSAAGATGLEIVGTDASANAISATIDLNNVDVVNAQAGVPSYGSSGSTALRCRSTPTASSAASTARACRSPTAPTAPTSCRCWARSAWAQPARS